MQCFVETALDIVSREGLEGLTLQRLATETDYAVGAMYRYFRSKDALVAAMQCRVLESIDARLARAQSLVEHATSRATASEVLPLAQLVAAADLYRMLPSLDPAGFRLLGLTVGDPRELLSMEEGQSVMRATWPLLSRIARLFAFAADAGALRDGDASERAVVLWSALHGVLSLRKLARFDVVPIDPDRLGRELTTSLLLGWGASPEVLDEARTVSAEGLSPFSDSSTPPGRSSSTEK